MTDSEMMQISADVGARLLRAGATVTTAESCTGGWIAKVLTDIPGSSAWFERGFVTYSNEAKSAMVGVSPGTLDSRGAVSEPVVREMARGALHEAGASYAVAVSGIAGPDGGSPEKPVGTVWFGFASAAGALEARLQHFHGDRDAVRRQSVAYALLTLRELFLQNT